MLKSLFEYNSKENLWIRNHTKELIDGIIIFDTVIVIWVCRSVVKKARKQNLNK